MVVSYANLLISSGWFQPELICVEGIGNFLAQQIWANLQTLKLEYKDQEKGAGVKARMRGPCMTG